jgi:hypothetical protein
MLVKISNKSLKLLFHECTPEYIKTVCKGKCCESAKHGTIITIHPSEEETIKLCGGVVKDGLLQSKDKCVFKTKDNLCSLHATGKKPFGCIASPFTLNKNNTLIVRNRYKLLKCYKESDKKPAYKVFQESLDEIFGMDIAELICETLDKSDVDFYVNMPNEKREMLIKNDQIKKAVL